MVFALSNTLHSESGLLAVTLMGMMLANMKNVDIEDILFFKESLSVLLISMLFIVLAARLEFAPLIDFGWAAAGMLAVIMFVARPISVLISTLGSQLDWRARTLLCWVAPRGIVAAAVSALFALRLGELGYEGASVLVPLTFLIIIGTVFIQGITARPLAHLLKVAEPEPRGVLIVGANPVARHLAKTLDQLEIPVLLADTGWENVRAARMEGFNTYFGRVVSEHADRHMDMTGIGKLLALSPHSTLNALACIRFKPEFGSGNIYRLQTSQDEQEDEKKAEHPSFTGRRLFGEEISLAKLLSLFSQGAEIHTTTLSEDFDYTRYWEKYQHRATPLFALDPQEKLHFISTDEKLQPKPGWKIASLLPAEEIEQKNEARTKERSKESRDSSENASSEQPKTE
jgi:NhaP-type Na+/H+ or K+/H+ antiporter